MEDAEREDSPCSSMITKSCELTDSQEEKPRNCPLAPESETFVDSNSDHFSQSDCTGIVVVSAPSSADQQLPREDADYYTAPEHHSLSHLSSDDGQNPKIRVLEEGSGDEPESKRAKVVPGEESVDLGETEGDEKEITVVGSGESDGGEKPQIENGESNGGLEVTGLMKDGVAIELGVSRGEGESSGANKIEDFRSCDEGFEVRSAHQLPPSVEGREKIEEEDDLAKATRQKLLELDDQLMELFKVKEAEDDASKKQREASAKFIMGLGKLPTPLRAQDVMGLVKDIFNVKIEEVDPSEKVDILELAKELGWFIPGPRWWPPPGEDDENYPD